MRIAFSGACHSGKTTMINLLKNKYPYFKILGEEVRKYDIDIDEIRSKPNEYFSFQEKIIMAKILQEIDCVKNTDVLIDRSIFDSFYYLNTYINIEELTKKNQKNFYRLSESLHNHFEFVQEFCYDHICLMSPIPIVEDDKYRPKNLRDIQHKEYQTIKKLIELNFNGNTIESNDLSELERYF
jgi:deoxyadenosine/deoxycytidine kinase